MNALMEALGVMISGLSGLLAPGKKRARLRTSIEDDLKLLDDLGARSDFGVGSLAHDALVQQVTNDVLVLANQGPRKPNFDWSTFIIGLLLALGFGFWTVQIARRPGGAPWTVYATGAVAFMGLLALIGAFPSSASETQEPPQTPVDE
jgi:hypothetical protein